MDKLRSEPLRCIHGAGAKHRPSQVGTSFYYPSGRLHGNLPEASDHLKPQVGQSFQHDLRAAPVACTSHVENARIAWGRFDFFALKAFHNANWETARRMINDDNGRGESQNWTIWWHDLGDIVIVD